MADQFQDAGFEIRRELDAAVARVNADPALTPFGKVQRANELREAARPKLEALREAKSQAAAARRKGLEDSLFGRSLGEGADPATVMSHRDAARVVASLEEAAAAESMMRSAIQIGDTVLQKTLLRKAYEAGWIPTINAWAEANPTRNDDVNDLWDIRHPGNSGNSFRAQFFESLADTGAFDVDHHSASPPQGLAGPQALANLTNRQNAERSALLFNAETPVDSSTGAEGDVA